MRAGYPWTNQIKLMLQLATTSTAEMQNGVRPDYQQHLEILGGLDMDAWILGRRSAPCHAWVNHCLGRPGIERITGLPRSLLDLIARASLLQDVHEDLQNWKPGNDLSTAEDKTIITDSWYCYSLATRLFLHRHVRTSADSDQILEELTDKVFSIASRSYDDHNFNQRILLWPLCLIISTTDRETRPDGIVSTILRVLQSSGSGSLFGDPLLRLINELVQRESSGTDGNLEIIARDLSLEVGIW